ncbi:MAG: glycosyltransferase family 9 protein [Anaerolineae bacterium]|nr:glycosyltransferase family 9 protein [Anaerolineae bacterium]
MLFKRIILVLPCCIGDVVLATATLQALRRAFPGAHIAWAVGSWSKSAVDSHPLLDAVVDTGPEALPMRTPGGMLRFVRQLRAGHYDLLVSLVRSPWMSVAALLSGIPTRAGIDSAGRGFGYTVRAAVDPQTPRHEADIYLDVARALGVDVTGCYANVPVPADARGLMARRGLSGPYFVVNPAGGRNPGMTMDVKRYPPASLAALTDRLAQHLSAQPVLLAGPGDAEIVAAVQGALNAESRALVGELSFGEIAALAAESQLYVGNDTGLTHYAAAAGARTVMIMGPSDPARYAPFTPKAIALWKAADLPRGGVAAGAPQSFDWGRDGISVDEAEVRILAWLADSSEGKPPQ